MGDRAPGVKTRKKFLFRIIIIILLIGSGYFFARLIHHKEKNFTTPYDFPELRFFPKKANISDDNPMTLEAIKLGRFLFYDGRLSGSMHPDSLMTCASCHHQVFGFGTNLDHPVYHGFPRGKPVENFPEGKKTPHVTLPLVNLVYNFNGYGRSGFLHADQDSKGSGRGLDSTSLESMVWIKIVSDRGLVGSIRKTEEAISSIPMYKSLFKSAFGSEKVTMDRISMAIAQFIRSIIAYRFRYYQYLQQNAILTSQELRGSIVFFSEEAGCFHCHSGSLLMTTNNFYNNGTDSIFNDEEDRFGWTGMVKDKGVYRVPSLINCELNSPYMHDGRFSTLREVIDFYSEGVIYSANTSPLIKGLTEGGVHLSVDQKEDLLAFLLTLTDREILEDTTLSCPTSLGRYGIQYEINR
jgi:cytochrome c peroxidase